MGRGRDCEGIPPNPCATGRAVRSRRGAARACARETAAGCSRVVSPLAPVEGSGDGALRPSPRSGRAGKRSGERGRGAESGGEEQKAGERSGDAALRRTGAMMGGGGGTTVRFHMSRALVPEETSVKAISYGTEKEQ